MVAQSSGCADADLVEAWRLLKVIDGCIEAGAVSSHLVTHAPSASVLLLIVQIARQQGKKLGRSLGPSHAAAQKNAAAREWVRDEWRQRTDKGQSKASFGRQYAALVKMKFELAITDRQIETRWLRKI